MSQERLQMILEMLANNNTDTFLRYAAALEYRKMGDSAEAIKYLRSLMKDSPEYLPTYYQLGSLLEEKGQSEKAIEVYKEGRVVAKKQNDSKTLGELTEALMLLDVYDDEELI